MSNQITVQQLLHGYSDGHRLIASSTTVPQEISRDIRIISDLSGNVLRNGFETYLTAYPIPEMGSFALARTWYAEEMKRPGCVWTQTLLIDFSDLAYLRQLSSLNRLFARPTGSVEQYTRPITVNVDDLESEEQTRTTHSPYVPAIVSLLYKGAPGPVYVPTGDRLKLEDIVFDLWSQQWPRLRRSFTFCTGALSPRTFRGQPLDLQIMPDTYRFSDEGKAIASVLREQVAGWLPEWISRVIEDLQGATPLRTFLWRYGADARAHRNVLPSLVDAYTALGNKPWDFSTASQTIEQIASSFPTAKDAATVKAAMFVPAVSAAPRDPEELALLLALATTAKPESFLREDLQLRQRSHDLAARSPIMAEQVLIECERRTANQFFSDIIAGVATGIPAPATTHLAKDFPNLFYVLLRSNPRLLESPSVWRAIRTVDQHMLDVLLPDLNIDEGVRNNIIGAALDAENEEASKKLFTLWPVQTVLAILDWLTRSFNRSATNEWLNMLRDQHSVVAHWMVRNPQLSIRIANPLFLVVKPNELSCLRDFNPVDWISEVPTDAGLTDWRSQLTAAFLLAGGLSSSNSEAWQLVQRTFSLIHQTQASARLEATAWNILEPLLPGAKKDKPWDRCERLREALILAYARNDWPIGTIEEFAGDKYLWDLLIKTYRAMRKKNKIPKQIRTRLDQLARSPWDFLPWV